MRHRRTPPKSGYFGADRAARVSLGIDYEPGHRYADAEIHASEQGFRFVVIPSVDETIFGVRGSAGASLDLIRRVTVDYDAREVWGGRFYGIAMELGQLISMLLTYGRAYYRIQWSEHTEVAVERIDLLAPETISVRKGTAGRIFEQYVSGLDDGSEERWYVFEEREIVEFVWPLSEPSGGPTPVLSAARVGAAADKCMDRSLAASAAAAYPDDTFLSYARARAGAYTNALAETRQAMARTGNALFGLPSEPMTDFFTAERLARRHQAGARVREYVLSVWNAQLISRWCRQNGWPDAELVFVPEIFTSHEWAEAQTALLDGGFQPQDIFDLVESERLVVSAVEKRHRR